MVVAFHRVPEDLPQRRRVGRQVGHHPLGQVGRGQRQALQHPRPREVKIHRVVEDDVDHRKIEFARRPHGFHAGKSLKVDRKRIGYLVFDLPGAAAHPVGEHNHLVLRKVGDGVHRRVDY